MSSSGWSYILFEATVQCNIKSLVSNEVDENEISLDTKDQPDNGLEKRPKHVVVPKIRYVNTAP